MQWGSQPCLNKGSVRIPSIIYLPWCFTVWSGPPTAPSHRSSPSTNTRICQARTPLLPALLLERGYRQSHKWHCASPSLLARSGFRPLVCQEGCSSIMWCVITIVELFHHLQWCFSSLLDEFCYLHSELWSKVWQLYNCLPDIAGRESWCSLTPNLKWARDKQHYFTEMKETTGSERLGSIFLECR